MITKPHVIAEEHKKRLHLSKEDFIFLTLIVLSAVFYFNNILFSDLWSDEVYTKAMVTSSISDMFSLFRNDLHPPLYFIVLKVFTSLFGSGAISLRAFSVIGVLSTLVLGYFSGQRIFGKQGAIYFCLMLVSLPMLAIYSHEARMYTWAAFSITGVFIYSYLFLKTEENRDLVFLFMFSLLAIYMHYYSMVAAFVANAFVLLFLLFTKNKKWKIHLVSVLVLVILFIPWVSMFVVQVARVQQAFWAPQVNLDVILTFIINPFTEKFWTTNYSYSLIILIYSITVFTIISSFSKYYVDYRMLLWLSISIFMGTLLVIIIISLISRPVLYYRYAMTIVTMLIVPATIFIVKLKWQWLKMLITGVILFLGVKVSLDSSTYSYGPYKQTVEYISTKYPHIQKVLHITEHTAGPMVEYAGKSKLVHCWLKAKMSNVDAFKAVKRYTYPKEFLSKGEEFCIVKYINIGLNKENFDLVLSQSNLIRTDTVFDNKVEYGNPLLVYILNYKGE
jgi:uncharacterized membrane protein